MSNVAALIKDRALEIGDGIYLERADGREPKTEEYLRGWVARLPSFVPHQKRLRRFVSHTRSFEAKMQVLDTAGLVSELKTSGLAMRRHGFSDQHLAHAFASIREASSRILGLRHHDVQLMGGRALLRGNIAEMQTGEGKTLVATLAACTAAAAGAAVHVITVNDYLAERDAKVNTPLYEFFGLSVGVVLQGMSPADRRAQYARDIVYVSNKELVFDYLKDRIATAGASAAQYRLRRLYRADRCADVILRGLHVAIVDEADSVLIDEARTPLIISETRPDEQGAELYRQALDLAAQLKRGEHFETTSHHELHITASGEQRMREMTKDMSGVWTSSLWRMELTEKALTAIHSFHRDQHYIVAEGKIQIVDEFTGRVMPDRSWEGGLHQMIEAKENCEITGQRNTLSRMTYQRFFRRYLLLCGMTGTAKEIAPELRRVYDLEVVNIPTHRRCQRRRFPDRAWLTTGERWSAVVDRAIELSRLGRSVLIGTRSVEASEHLGACFQQQGVPHTVLNARQDKQEADIVSLAGQPGKITIATNMAGRGTDIKLAPEVEKSGGLHVILTEFHESSRVDRQLFGRSARQGEPGSAEAMVSLDDELFVRYAPLWRRLARAIATKRGSLPAWFLKLMVRYAQRIAEFRNARIRFATLKQDKKLQRLLGFSGNPN
jgi:preprotein translocase subunit SecA